jgi:hypothetical protein
LGFFLFMAFQGGGGAAAPAGDLLLRLMLEGLYVGQPL